MTSAAGKESDDGFEYRRLKIDPHLSRSATAAMLSIRAEFTGWELARSLKFYDGSRLVYLRRRRTSGLLPDLSV
ncbi:hypothetical protein EH165_07255 [Nakamurella antarctica]|uniref:Dihydroorotate dehydrogenase n=2 Tax=Nakamurella antarctica TaxID=1902245 RepID=A0A3G8ZRM9_9ACTN|nr:hypothetical protein EH165_07255 [Nakamurella antarctica]